VAKQKFAYASLSVGESIVCLSIADTPSGVAPFGEAAERAAASGPEAEAEVAERIGVWLGEWTKKGLLCDVIPP